MYSTSTAHIWRETCHISWKWDRRSLNVWIQINPSSSNFSFTSIHPYIAQGMWKCLGLVSFKRFCFSQANDIILIICPVTIYCKNLDVWKEQQNNMNTISKFHSFMTLTCLLHQKKNIEQTKTVPQTMVSNNNRNKTNYSQPTPNHQSSSATSMSYIPRYSMNGISTSMYHKNEPSVGIKIQLDDTYSKFGRNLNTNKWKQTNQHLLIAESSPWTVIIFQREKSKTIQSNPMILLMEEILHQLICSLSHYLQGFIHPRWCRISSINSMAPFCRGHISNVTSWYWAGWIIIDSHWAIQWLWMGHDLFW